MVNHAAAESEEARNPLEPSLLTTPRSVLVARSRCQGGIKCADKIKAVRNK